MSTADHKQKKLKDQKTDNTKQQMSINEQRKNIKFIK